MAQFAGNAHWAETPPMFAPSLCWSARPSPSNCKKTSSMCHWVRETAPHSALSSGRFAGLKVKESGDERPAAMRFIAFDPKHWFFFLFPFCVFVPASFWASFVLIWFSAHSGLVLFCPPMYGGCCPHFPPIPVFPSFCCFWFFTTRSAAPCPNRYVHWRWTDESPHKAVQLVFPHTTIAAQLVFPHTTIAALLVFPITAIAGEQAAGGGGVMHSKDVWSEQKYEWKDFWATDYLRSFTLMFYVM